MVADAERELVQQQLEGVRASCAAGGGLLPGEEVVRYYPPEMASRAALFGISGTNVDGTRWQVGDTDVRFPLHSISKVFTYGLALEDNGREATMRRVGVEPSGDPFNSLTFDEVNNRPFNPMINAGALVAANLVHGRDRDEKVARLLDRCRVYSGNPDLAVDEEAGATLAHGGVNPITGEHALDREHTRGVLSVMNMCGMYDAAGEWAHDVGIPAKSGVSGGIMAAIPDHLGLGVYSPGLDRHGNSVRGVAVCRELSARFGLHVFADPAESWLGRVAQSG